MSVKKKSELDSYGSKERREADDYTCMQVREREMIVDEKTV
jgi:hypothetical protein